MRRGARQSDGSRSMARRQRVGSKLCITGSRHSIRKAAGVRVCGRRVETADRRADVDRPGHRQGGFHLPVAKPELRVGKCVLPGSVRQQGVRFGELSHRKRAGRGTAGLHEPGSVNHAGFWAALQHSDLPEWLPLRVRRTQRAGRIPEVRGSVKRKSRVARDAGMDRDLRWGRRAGVTAAIASNRSHSS